MATMRLLVVAESPVVRAGLRALLAAEPGFVIAGATATLDEATGDADLVVWVAPTGALVESALRPRWDEEAPEEAAAPEPALVVLADRVDPPLVRRALAAGARAVVPLDAGEATVVAAIHAAAAGLVTLPGELASALVGSAPVKAAALAAPSLPGVALTPREREVLALLAQGLANKQIAPRLGITEHTVKAHVAAIYEKVGAGNRAEATVAAARLGLLLL
jgi:DNA-binding NarL/FixJ family response regulator